jgi:hypothetical protein
MAGLKRLRETLREGHGKTGLRKNPLYEGHGFSRAVNVLRGTGSR